MQTNYYVPDKKCALMFDAFTSEINNPPTPNKNTIQGY